MFAIWLDSPWITQRIGKCQQFVKKLPKQSKHTSSFGESLALHWKIVYFGAKLNLPSHRGATVKDEATVSL